MPLFDFRLLKGHRKELEVIGLIENFIVFGIYIQNFFFSSLKSVHREEIADRSVKNGFDLNYKKVFHDRTGRKYHLT